MINPNANTNVISELNQLKPPVNAELSSFFEKISSMMNSIFTSQEQLTKKIDDVIQQNSAFIAKTAELESRIKKNEDKNVEYERRISQLESALDVTQQQQNANNIIIAGLPSNQPNKLEMVMKIMEKLQANITPGDITEIATINEKSNSHTTPKQLYLLKMRSMEAKMEIFAKKKCYKELLTTDIGLQGKAGEIFVRQHLTAYQAKLYNAAKKIKISENYRFLWIKENNIFLRKNDSSKVFKIRSSNDIEFVKSFKHENKSRHDTNKHQ